MLSSERLKKLRKKLGFNQKELSDLLFIKQCTLSNYETGKRKPSLKVCYNIIRLAKLKNIEIKLEYLMPLE
ncbi:MAG TPA: helix-turn-helix transcriptional regulator [Buchnera sp. (in: enterobacteria)]|nr:helix-turn-helix transcriptional regulator [Buchnera sp. (in: enterobacteria)]